MWHYSPFLSTPLTDFSYLWSPNYHKVNFDPLCVKLELKFMDCLEAYGLRKGSEKCADLLYDLSECNYGKFQVSKGIYIPLARMKIMGGVCREIVVKVFEHQVAEVCRFKNLQNIIYSALRAQAIQNERMKKYRAGKLAKPFDEHPPLDSYIYL